MTDLEIFEPGEAVPANDNVVTSWPSIMQMAEAISKSNLVPDRFRNKATDIAVAVMWGQEIGLGPMSALKYIVVIHGNAGLNAEGMGALVRKAGHSISGSSDSQRAEVTGKRRDTGDEMTVTFTMDDAKQAQLAGNNTWKQYPKSMLWSRAVSQLCRQLFQDVLMGLSYTEEEIESFSGAPSNGAPSQPTGDIVKPLAVQPMQRPTKPIDANGEIQEPRSTRRPPPSRRPSPSRSGGDEPAVDAASAAAPADEAVGAPGSVTGGTAAALADAAVIEDLKKRMNALGPIERKECKQRFADSFGKPDELRAEHRVEAMALVTFYEPEQ